VTSRETFLVLFWQWQQSLTIRLRKELGDWNSIPDYLEVSNSISLSYTTKRQTRLSLGNGSASREVNTPHFGDYSRLGSVDSAYSTLFRTDGNGVVQRLRRNTGHGSTKLLGLSALGVREPHTYQEASLTVRHYLLNFLETLTICLGKIR
jgi:hypothetical protein